MSTAEDVRVFLQSRGLADETIEAGAEGLVARWEQAARDAEHERYPFGIEDWLNELDGRQLIAELVATLKGALTSAQQARVKDADARVEAVTEPTTECLWGGRMATRMKWSAKSEWWYWRRPRAVADDFEGGS